MSIEPRPKHQHSSERRDPAPCVSPIAQPSARTIALHPCFSWGSATSSKKHPPKGGLGGGGSTPQPRSCFLEQGSQHALLGAVAAFAESLGPHLASAAAGSEPAGGLALGRMGKPAEGSPVPWELRASQRYGNMQWLQGAFPPWTYFQQGMASKVRVHGRTDMDRSASGTGIVPGQFPAPPSEVTPLAMRLLPAPLSRKASAFKASGPLLPMFPGANTGPEKQKKHPAIQVPLQVQIPTRKTGTNTNGRASPMVGVCSRGNPAKYLGINFNWGPSYGHLLHGDSCPRPAT